MAWEGMPAVLEPLRAGSPAKFSLRVQLFSGRKLAVGIRRPVRGAAHQARRALIPRWFLPQGLIDEALFVIGMRWWGPVRPAVARAGRCALCRVAHTSLPAAGLLPGRELPLQAGIREGPRQRGQQLGAAPLVQDRDPAATGRRRDRPPCSASRWVMVEAPPRSICTLPLLRPASSLM